MHESESAELLREDMGEGVTRLTLNRPGARNALSAALLDRLGEALEYIAADDAAHVVITVSYTHLTLPTIYSV